MLSPNLQKFQIPYTEGGGGGGTGTNLQLLILSPNLPKFQIPYTEGEAQGERDQLPTFDAESKLLKSQIHYMVGRGDRDQLPTFDDAESKSAKIPKVPIGWGEGVDRN